MLKSRAKKKRVSRNQKIQSAYARLMSAGAMRSAAVEALARKYELSEMTIYSILKTETPCSLPSNKPS